MNVMNIMKKTLGLLFTLTMIFLLTGCEIIEKEKAKKFIWMESSESISIVTHDSYVFNTANTVETPEITFAKDELPLVASDLLKTIRTTTDDLYCMEDGVTYTLTIVDEDDSSEVYWSDNANCNDNDRTFISTQHIEDLVELLITQ